jgi:lysozyme
MHWFFGGITMAIIAMVVASGQVRTSEKGLELIGDAESCQRDV